MDWQSIETAPKEEGRSVLVWNGERCAVADWIPYYGWWEGRKDSLGEPYGMRPQPTHWAPLEPPAE